MKIIDIVNEMKRRKDANDYPADTSKTYRIKIHSVMSKFMNTTECGEEELKDQGQHFADYFMNRRNAGSARTEISMVKDLIKDPFIVQHETEEDRTALDHCIVEIAKDLGRKYRQQKIEKGEKKQSKKHKPCEDTEDDSGSETDSDSMEELDPLEQVFVVEDKSKKGSKTLEEEPKTKESSDGLEEQILTKMTHALSIFEVGMTLMKEAMELKRSRFK